MKIIKLNVIFLKLYHYVLQSGRTPLYKMMNRSAIWNNQQVVEASIEAGVDLNAVDKVSDIQGPN